MEIISKICNKCLIEKEINLFYKRVGSPDGYHNQCISCKSEAKKIIYESTKGDPIKKEKNKKISKTYRDKNKKALSDKRKEYYEKNKERSLANDKIYYEKNKSKKMARRQKYREENREQYNKKERELKKNNPFHRMKCNIRTLIGNYIRNSGYSKKSKTQKILGCSYEEFKIHMESQFIENMTWENYGKWHVDHIIPISFALNEEELLRLNNYKNLKPLWGYDNLSKGDTIIEETELYKQIIQDRFLP